MSFVVDTHALLWWFTESPKLSDRVIKIFERSEKGDAVIFIPSIVLAEALSIFDKKRINFDFNNLIRELSESDNFIVISLDLPLLSEMVSLKDIPELHDKIIVATAKYLNLPLITKDEYLQSIDIIETFW